MQKVLARMEMKSLSQPHYIFLVAKERPKKLLYHLEKYNARLESLQWTAGNGS